MMHGGLGDSEVFGHFLRGEQATIAQSLAPTEQVVGCPNEGDLLEIERLAFPAPQAAFIEDIGDLAIAMSVEQAVDLSDQVGLELADLGDRQRPLHRQGARRSAREPHVDGNRLGLDQRDIGDQQTEDALALAHVDSGIVPDPRELIGQCPDALLRFAVEVAASSAARRS
ncbi:hypothetical protein [Mesorhizobium sp. M1365]|uniref:hypothetical protein n=1 Tax=Mesorhizobium sp. M1365 TaxID=2957090 RepID=UPI0033360E9D